MRKNAISAIILAAGYSSRMGVSKALLRYDNKNSFVKKALQVYTDFGCKEVVIVVNSELSNEPSITSLLSKNIKLVTNPYPDKGRFFSLKCGCKNLDFENDIFVHNVDNPFVEKNLLNELLANQGEYDYLYPSYKGKGGHPILLSQKVVMAITGENNFNQNLKLFLKNFPNSRIEVDNPNVTANINTKEDYNNYFKI